MNTGQWCKNPLTCTISIKITTATITTISLILQSTVTQKLLNWKKQHIIRIIIDFSNQWQRNVKVQSTIGHWNKFNYWRKGTQCIYVGKKILVVEHKGYTHTKPIGINVCLFFLKRVLYKTKISYLKPCPSILKILVKQQVFKSILILRQCNNYSNGCILSSHRKLGNIGTRHAYLRMNHDWMLPRDSSNGRPLKIDLCCQ